MNTGYLPVLCFDPLQSLMTLLFTLLPSVIDCALVFPSHPTPTNEMTAFQSVQAPSLDPTPNSLSQPEHVDHPRTTE